ncbi:hypothetical protein GGR52DRAFT_558821 [Hypoxylon sp. FL1284]|nr:hypothetical protein GGR52DRAFT_558821 [Hypoxylon sp. FL1284]
MEDWPPGLAEHPATTADNMTEHAAPGTKPASNDTSVDPDTCRICRGEGTAEEPLFYPCKCSGSIKYVHQDCLMEWLSHSQKKHCELCKTPFRFTKLYSPDMPQRLPFYIFATHMAKYIFRNVLVWLRAFLVMSVWLGWLPYLMRSVWSFLFWISDEGLGPSSSPALDGWDGRKSSLTITGTTTCASTPLLAATTTAATIGNVVERLPVSVLLKAISKPMNATPPYWLMKLLGLTTAAEKAVPGPRELLNATHVDQITISPSPGRPSSLLSNVSLLKDFTRHPAINRTIIAVLEGQIITLLVVVCFILIILVRDYVVQQQPEINMRAAFAAAENEAPPLVGPLNNAVPRGLGLEHDEDEDSEDDSVVTGDGEPADNEDDRDSVDGTDRARDVIGLQNPHQRPIAEFRRRVTRRDAEPGQESRRDEYENLASTSHVGGTVEPTSGFAATSSQGEVARRAFLNNLERRTDEEAGEATSRGSVREYSRIYREAGGNRERILQIIRDEGLEDRMQYWISVTAGKDTGASSLDLGNNPGSSAPIPDRRRSSRSPARPSSPNAARTSSDTSSWTWTDSDDVGDAASHDSKEKGKGKATESPAKENATWDSWGGEFGGIPPSGGDGDHDSPDNLPSSFLSAPTRPRAVSDGPQTTKTTNILANNSWSFSDLPPDVSGVPREAASGSSGPVHSALAFEPLSPPMSSPGGSGPAEPSDSRELGGESNRGEGTSHTAPPKERFSTNLSEVGRAELDETERLLSLGLGMSPAAEDVLGEGGMLNPADSGAGDGAGAFLGRATDIQPAGNAARPAGGIVERMADFMWRDVEPGPADDLEPQEAVDIFGDDQNAPFFDDDRLDDREDEVEMAPDVVEAAVAAGLDPEAVEDAEDFEGIMELIGMRGPVAGLFQNAIFCAFLVSISIFLCVFVPYNVGRVSVWIFANPARLLRIVFSASKFVQDGVLLVVGYLSTFMFDLIEAFRLLFRVEHGKQLMHTLRADAKQVASGAVDRILTSFMSEMPLISVSEVRNFSAISHEALLVVKHDIQYALSCAGRVVLFVFGGDYGSKLAMVRDFISVAWPATLQLLRAVPIVATHPGSWVLNLNLSEVTSLANPELAYWDANDRTWAIIAGYVSVCVLAGLYLARGTPFSTGQTAQEWEASIIDGLNQASGVMKVILIISIEMLIFPLYCGLLLDFALLPLFEGTSAKSRLLFTYNYPLTSIFVHWFVGTGYMFHFALFVSMCRKIMRKGVLYFIRDPDDPEFHPVRDVLERNVTTQLRKILFSAFVYGALVVVCLGGVVWGLSLALPNVLPIHYSSNEPVLEFPIDLLFYNFLMPLAVRFFKPSDGLHAMYTWWFRRCARALHLTWFLFGERRVDEEGTLALREDSPHRRLSWWFRFFLEINDKNEVVPKTWHDTFTGGKSKPASAISPEEMKTHDANKARLVESGQLIPHGRFVRSPASDQVKIPKGQSVFLNVSEQNVRSDGKLDRPETDLYSGTHYQFVYIPPWFRARIFLFIFFIWIFAALTGVGFTIIPLVFGRRMFKILIPSHIRTNDIYAFSIGIYILGSFSYFIFHLRPVLGKVRTWTATVVSSMLDRHATQRALHLCKHACRLIYTYVVLLIIFPLLITLLVELYLLMPLHTYLYPTAGDTTKRLDRLREGHTIRVIQAWTLGILYLKLSSRALSLYGGRPAHAVRAVLRRGWLEPDVAVLTRAFVIPSIVVSAIMIFMPPAIAWAMLRRVSDVSAEVPHEMRVLTFRLAYPLTALFWAGLLMTRSMVRVFERWQVRIRDEAYLMGERLHNFGGTASKVSGWRGSTRL